MTIVTTLIFTRNTAFLRSVLQFTRTYLHTIIYVHNIEWQKVKPTASVVIVICRRVLTLTLTAVRREIEKEITYYNLHAHNSYVFIYVHSIRTGKKRT